MTIFWILFVCSIFMLMFAIFMENLQIFSGSLLAAIIFGIGAAVTGPRTPPQEVRWTNYLCVSQAGDTLRIEGRRYSAGQYSIVEGVKRDGTHFRLDKRSCLYFEEK